MHFTISPGHNTKRLSLRVSFKMATITINTLGKKNKLFFSINLELMVYMPCLCAKKIKYVFQLLNELEEEESKNSQLIQVAFQTGHGVQ